jgi:hypothetical protein
VHVADPVSGDLGILGWYRDDREVQLTPHDLALEAPTKVNEGLQHQLRMLVRTRPTKRGSQVRAPSSLMPNRHVPVSVGELFNASRMPSLSSSIRAATGRSRWPASVSWARLPERSKSSAPTQASSSAMRLDRDDWVTWARCAASAKLPSVAAK